MGRHAPVMPRTQATCSEATTHSCITTNHATHLRIRDVAGGQQLLPLRGAAGAAAAGREPLRQRRCCMSAAAQLRPAHLVRRDGRLVQRLHVTEGSVERLASLSS